MWATPLDTPPQEFRRIGVYFRKESAESVCEWRPPAGDRGEVGDGSEPATTPFGGILGACVNRSSCSCWKRRTRGRRVSGRIGHRRADSHHLCHSPNGSVDERRLACRSALATRLLPAGRCHGGTRAYELCRVGRRRRLLSWTVQPVVRWRRSPPGACT